MGGPIVGNDRDLITISLRTIEAFREDLIAMMGFAKDVCHQLLMISKQPHVVLQ